eukprot:12905560-Prorocentrum_lima.AAC.1
MCNAVGHQCSSGHSGSRWDEEGDSAAGVSAVDTCPGGVEVEADDASSAGLGAKTGADSDSAGLGSGLGAGASSSGEPPSPLASPDKAS